ncbi:MAG: beta-N-acetylhexosaminidase [Spirochaetaceae bacterium]|jgi:hexosaminidase|nr:beta-N-acetylhexosaminidase [Spirochaetaceae bacterium]
MTEYSIIPRPASVCCLTGSFECPGIPNIAFDSVSDFNNEARVFADQMRDFGQMAGSAVIKLIKDDMPLEAYRLKIDADGVSIRAATGAGAYHGLQTLRQLILSCYDNGVLKIPCGVIEDYPRFPWRGYMLDCSRNFFSTNFIKRMIDALSLHHVNIFHWHLTDDQGWRLPVNGLPKLTETGAFRREYRHEDRLTGGFYTEDDIRDIVTFAAARHIDVVPEIDFPGHASAILAAYPSLGCTGGPYHVEDRFGVFHDVLCAGNDAVFDFAASVFDSVVRLFPSQFVHIGGDEVPSTRWAKCPKCGQRVAKLGLSNHAGLQSWMTSRFASMLKEYGKTVLAWDEVLENTEKFPLPENLIVMSWRGREGGSKAALMGHRVIMTPNNEGCYLDYKNADELEEPGRLSVNTLFQSWSLNLIGQNLNNDAAQFVLGGQGNLWTELIYAGKIAEYMTFPRICALAEAFWSNDKSKNFEEFKLRLAVHQARLDKLGILQYREI